MPVVIYCFFEVWKFLLYVIAKPLLVLVDLSLGSSCFFRSDWRALLIWWLIIRWSYPLSTSFFDDVVVCFSNSDGSEQILLILNA